ncbi:uncharacterized protein LOC115881017 [Sitophilus oryzae]|uniref:Uncharacterized protein LOC115881017 n=1 Tax=Sitophilus oryzae TaxID=7048 RepID=A0A6J2XUI7_SITOR|nr:uncharacterized protein LOC115881017 [Sitophilus oryzae]
MPSGIPQIPNFNIKVIFLVHFLFISISCMGSWSGNGFLFYNSLLIFLLLWSIFHSESQEPLQLAIVIDGFSVMLDIILLIMNFPTRDDILHYSAGNTFSAAIAIIHLLIRPVLTYLLVRNLEDRGGNTGTISNMFAANRTESYEDIDRPSPASQNTAQDGYTFASAQPI